MKSEIKWYQTVNTNGKIETSSKRVMALLGFIGAFVVGVIGSVLEYDVNGVVISLLTYSAALQGITALQK